MSYHYNNESFDVIVAPEIQSVSKTAENAGVTMSFHEVAYEVKYKPSDVPCSKTKKRTILHNVSAVLAPGLNALMGPTGSGKTSLLDILAGRKDPEGIKNGRVLMNGRQKKQSEMRSSTGYVVQDDVVMGTLTVRENLAFSANMRLPASKYTAEARRKKVDKVIEDLGLVSCADTRVGNEFIRGVSGGERKRTSIGMELLIDPPVLFLDEPTTGLDAYTAGSIMRLLANMGKKGRTIIVSIHQPRYSIFSLFDHLLILSRGDIVYNGPCDQSVQYFASVGFQCPQYHNPADYILDVVNGEIKSSRAEDAKKNNRTGQEIDVIDIDDGTIEKNIEANKILAAEELVKLYGASQTAEQQRAKLKAIEASSVVEIKGSTVSIAGEPKYANGTLHQVKYLMKRNIVDLVRNPMTFVAAIGSSIVIALLVGLIFYQLDTTLTGIQDRAGGLYFLVTVNVMNNMQALETFIQKRNFFVHEKASGYYMTSSYFFSRVTADIIPNRWLPLLFFAPIVYFMMGLQLDVGKFFFFLLNLGLTSTAGTALVFCISSSFRVFGLAILGLMVPMLLMMLFGGFLVNTSSLLVWLEWLKWFSIFRYGINGLLVNEMDGMVFINNASYPGFDPSSSTPCYSDVTNSTIPGCATGESYLETQNIPYDTWGKWQNVVALTVMAIGYFILAFFQLWRTSIYK